MIELEFHISPRPSSSRPQGSRGTWCTSASRFAARTGSRLITVGSPTANLRSGIEPPRQARTSAEQPRPSQGGQSHRLLDHDAALGGGVSHTGPISMT